MTNTFGVNISDRNAPAGPGSTPLTGVAFYVGKLGKGSATAPAKCHSVLDLESYTAEARTSESVAAWDWCDVFFREGGATVYVLNYSGTLEEALAVLLPSLGPGQVVVPETTLTKANAELLQKHCEENNRVYLADVAKATKTAAEIEALGKLLQEAEPAAGCDRIGLFGFWLNAPAPQGVAGGSAREVPASAAIAAGCQLVDEEGNPGRPPGGTDMPLRYCTGVIYDPTDAERNTIFAKSANTFKKWFGTIVNWGFVTAVPQSALTPFWQLSASRTRMFIDAEAKRIGQKYYMTDIDGEGRVAGKMAAELKAMLKKLYAAGALYGATAAEAYEVSVNATINTSSSIAEGHLNAVIEAKLSLYAAQVNITNVSVPITGTIV